MARARTVTKLPLSTWADIMGLNPLHFAGLYVPNQDTVCEQPWLQHAYQAADRVGREEVAYAIYRAETDIEKYLRYRLLPSWEVDEWQPTAGTPSTGMFRTEAVDARGFAQGVSADWGYFISGGIRSQELIEAGVAITFSDDDNDGYDETATVVVTTDFAPCEIHVFLPGYDGEAQWELRPVHVEDTAPTATITFRAELAVDPTVYEDIVPPADDSHLRGADALNPLTFVQEVDVYRIYNDPQLQATMMWEYTGGCAECGGSSCAACAYSTQPGCLTVRGRPRISFLGYRPATWNNTTKQFDSTSLSGGRQPDVVRLYYYSGWRDKRISCPNIVMDEDWQQVVAKYAAALLERPICECNNVHAYVEHWQRDMAIAGEDGVRISESNMENPLGTTRGAIEAWQHIMAEGAARGRAVTA